MFGWDRHGTSIQRRLNLNLRETVPNIESKQDNTGDTGEHAEFVTRSHPRVRGGAVCNPDTIIRLKPARPTDL